MPKNDQFPWDVLRAECLRLVCSQLLQASKHEGSFSAPARKEDMITFLQSVSNQGLDSAVELAAKNPSPRKSNAATPKATPQKRRISAVEQDMDGDYVEEDIDETYNTRYKGVKRVKVRADPPEKSSRSSAKVGRPRGRPPKSAALTTPSAIKAKAASISAPNSALKRGRGRPRKSDPTPIKRGRGRPGKSAASGETLSSPKQVFDGVVLQKRNANYQVVGEPPAEEGDEDGEGEVDDESEDVVLAAINGTGKEDLSSLGGSNKENDPNEAFKYTPPGDNNVESDAEAVGDAVET